MKKEITLIDNVFNKSDLRFLLYRLLDEKINFHKLHRLQEWEGNHYADTSHDDNRINELKEVRDTIFQDIDGKSFKVKSQITIELIEK